MQFAPGLHDKGIVDGHARDHFAASTPQLLELGDVSRQVGLHESRIKPSRLLVM